MRRFIPGRADLEATIKTAFFEAKPAVTVTGKTSSRQIWTPIPTNWTEEYVKTLKTICEAMQNNAMQGADHYAPYHLATDASVRGLGGVLFQLLQSCGDRAYTPKDFDDIRILLFFSFRLQDAETRYSMPEKEMFAIVKTLREVHWLVEAFPFPTHVYTDHLSIIQAMCNFESASPKTCDSETSLLLT